MSFAQQLAARAAETHNANASLPSRSFQIDIERSGSKPARPGRNKVGSAAGSVRAMSPPSSSPSLFADQLKRRAGCEDEGVPVTMALQRQSATLESRCSSFAGALSDVFERSSTSLPRQSCPPPRAPASRNFPSLFQQGENSKCLEQRSIVPNCENSDGEDVEDDEYASVGFSLMDASAISTTERKEGGVVEDYDGSEARGLGRITPMANNRREHPSLQSTVDSRPEPELPFQNGLSPIKSSFVQPSSPPCTFSEQKNCELQSKLQRQLLRCQTPEESKPKSLQTTALTSSVQGSLPEHPSLITKTKTPAHWEKESDSMEKENCTTTIFGAWKQIESLERRVCEAEERARRECQRAEKASFKLRLVMEQKNNLNADRDGSYTHDSSSVESSRILHVDKNAVPAAEYLETFGKMKAGADSAYSEREGAAVNPTGPGPIMTIVSSSSKEDPTFLHDEENVATSSWKRRALEAENCLGIESERQECSAVYHASQNVYLTSDRCTPPQNSIDGLVASKPMAAKTKILNSGLQMKTSSSCTHLPDESDLIQLKNAEIDVLRSQIRRLERRIQEDCRFEDTSLRSAYGNGNCHRNPGPPLVVASEYEMDELRLLSDQLRHLQCRRSKEVRLNNGMSGTRSTAGESTLSSSLDGNENNYRGGREDEEEVNEAGENSSSWSLCCIRRMKRGGGYGRVNK